jgi:hypothetical protein
MAADPIQLLTVQYSHFHPNSDGDCDIDSLSYLPFENPDEVIPAGARLALVLVEARLLDPLPDCSPFRSDDLLARLRRLKDDLRAEGLFSRFITARVYVGPRHQDGRTLLSIRQFFRDVRQEYPRLEGAILVGAFPEAMLVRLMMWNKGEMENVKIGGVTYAKAGVLSVVPGFLAHRADVVLGDLTGNWEACYRQDPEKFPSFEAIPDSSMGSNWPAVGTVFKSTRFDFGTLEFQDFFWIQDADFTLLACPPDHPDKVWAEIHALAENPELGAEDRLLPNPVARPDMAVSRINARNVAVTPDPAVVGTDGRRYLDKHGDPQLFHTNQQLDLMGEAMVQDPILERRLLVEYLDRNHAFRTGAFSNLPFRPAAIGYEFSAASLDDYLSKASAAFSPGCVCEDASLLDYVQWLNRAAILRGLACHSTRWHSKWGTNYDAAGLESAAGFKPWRWVQQGNEVRPTFEGLGPFADQFLHRTLWHNRVLWGKGGSVVVHSGCEANTPARVDDQPYNAPEYGRWQNVEGILFYLNAVAVVARAKEFNDLPNGFSEALGACQHATLGEAWKATFDKDGHDAALAPHPDVNKRCYWWSILGDWSLCLDRGYGPNRWKHIQDLGEVGKAPAAVGRPAAYAWEADRTGHLFYRSADNYIHELWFAADSGWQHAHTTYLTGAPPAAGDPCGYAWEGDGTQHVFYRGADGHIHQLWYIADSRWHRSDVTFDTGAPLAAGDPCGYAWEDDRTQHVFYRGVDGHIHQHWYIAGSGWHRSDVTFDTGATPAAGDPCGYAWELDRTQHVFYRGTDNHVHELWYVADTGWHHSDTGQAAGAPLAAGDPCGYAWEGDASEHVFYRSQRGVLQELWYHSTNYEP